MSLKNASPSGSACSRIQTKILICRHGRTLLGQSHGDHFMCMSLGGPSSRAFESLVFSHRFVHKDHIGTAAAILQHVKASFRHSMSATLKLTLEGCFKVEPNRLLGPVLAQTMTWIIFLQNAGHIAGVEVQPEAATPEDSQPVSFSAEEAADLLPGNEEEQDAETTAVLWPSQVASCDTEVSMDVWSVVCRMLHGGVVHDVAVGMLPQSGLKVSLLLLPCEIFNADRDSCTPNHKTRTASIIRGRNEMVMKEMWESLQVGGSGCSWWLRSCTFLA